MSAYSTVNFQPYPARFSPASYPAFVPPAGRSVGYTAQPPVSSISYPAPSPGKPVGYPTQSLGKPVSYPAQSLASPMGHPVSPAPPARNQGARQQGGSTPFYSGYGQYLYPSQYPSAMQQMNTAATQWANEWASDVIVRTPWAEMIPSFTEASRMWLRGAQERLMARRPSLPKSEDWQAIRARAANGVLLRDFSRLA